MKLYSKNQLKESRIYFDKKPPRFMTLFIMTVLILILITLIVSSFVTRPYILRAQGVVSANDTHYVSTYNGGTILEVFAKEGSSVKSGQQLMVLSNGQEQGRIQALMLQIEEAERKLETMDKYQTALDSKANTLLNEGAEQEYYGYVEYYLAQCLNETYTKDILRKNIIELKEKHDTLTNEIVIREQALDQLHEQDILRREEISAEITRYRAELEPVQREIKTLEEQTGTPVSQSEQIYAQLTMELGKARTQTLNQLEELKINLSLTKEQIQSFVVHAANDGVIHYVSPMTVGLSLPQNQVIGEISKAKTEDLFVDAYIPAADHSKLEEGNTVRIGIVGVNELKYGTLKGIIEQIDKGTVSQETQEGVQVFYRLRINLLETELYSKEDTIKIMKSMPVYARIVYDEETYLEWFLELIRFKN